MNRPTIYYVDDEPHNLTVFEASLPSEWEIFTFENPMDALKKMASHPPWIVMSDQRMPTISGVEFLELSMKVHPNAVRMIVTGYSDENLVVESVRKAKIFDYLRKPWDAQDLEQSIARGIDFYSANEAARILQEELKNREAILQEQNSKLTSLANELEHANQKEILLRKELECWVPPFLLMALRDNKVSFPIKKDLVGITFDIVGSSNIHEVTINGKHLRSLVLKSFTEVLTKHGGWRESHSGDSAYGHFGLFEEDVNPFDSALAVAREFRVCLRNISSLNGIDIECGISLHLANDAVVDVHVVEVATPKGKFVQKSFDTTSADIDLLHRMEKLMHKLPGTNIVMSEQFFSQLSQKPNVPSIGSFKFVGHDNPIKLYLITSDKIKVENVGSLLSAESSDWYKKIA